jgi:hypothetical protein
MKFDAIIMNPPYSGIEVKVLKQMIGCECFDDMVTLQPLNRFFRLNNNGLKANLTSKGEVSVFTKYIRVKDGNLIWPALSLGYPVCIGLFSHKPTPLIKWDIEGKWCLDGKPFTMETKKLSDIGNPFMINKFKHSLFNKVITNMNNNLSVIRMLNEYNDNCYYTDLFTFNGSIITSLLLSPPSNYIRLNGEVVNGENKSCRASTTTKVKFNSLTEAKNYLIYINTNFIKTILSELTFDRHINSWEASNIPIIDFTTPVTNERIQKEFNLTDEEMSFIEDFGKQLNGIKINWSKYDK